MRVRSLVWILLFAALGAAVLVWSRVGVAPARAPVVSNRMIGQLWAEEALQTVVIRNGPDAGTYQFSGAIGCSYGVGMLPSRDIEPIPSPSYSTCNAQDTSGRASIGLTLPDWSDAAFASRTSDQFDLRVTIARDGVQTDSLITRLTKTPPAGTGQLTIIGLHAQAESHLALIVITARTADGIAIDVRIRAEFWPLG